MCIATSVAVADNTKGDAVLDMGSVVNGNGDDQSAVLLAQQQQQQQQLQDSAQIIDMNDAYLQSRTEELMTIQREISTLSGMFTQMATMIKQHGELTGRIDANINVAVDNVSAGQEQLMQYLARINTNRGLIIKIFFVLAVFIIFMAVFVMR